MQLRNNLIAGSLTVTPAVRTADGVEVALDPITVSPGDVQTVNVTDAVAKKVPYLIGQPNAYGSIVLRYRAWSMRNLFASVMVHDTGHPIMYHFDASPKSTASVASSREGIWWLPTAQTKDYLVLTNQSDHSISGNLWLYDSTGRSWTTPVTLGGRQTQRMSARDLIDKAGLQGTYGGIKVDVPVSGLALDSVHIVYDEMAGFAANMKMFDATPAVTTAERDYDGSKVWSTRAPLLALSNPDPALGLPKGVALSPQLLIRNTQGHPVQVQLRFHWMGESIEGHYVMPSISLQSYETRIVDIKAMQDSGSIPTTAYWAGVTLSTNGKPDGVMAVATSYDSTLRYGSQTPFSDQLAVHLEGTEWRVDDTHTTIMAIGNGGAQPVRVAFTILYAHGAKEYNMERQIEPNGQFLLNFQDLIRRQEPDKNGEVLPVGTTSGSYRLNVISHPLHTALYEGKVITDKTFGYATYGCPICCGYVGVSGMSPNPAYGFVSENSPVDISATDECTHVSENIDEFFTSWSSANTSIFAMHTGEMTGVSLGSAGMSAAGTSIPAYGHYNRGCPIFPDVGNGNGNVTTTPYKLYVLNDATGSVGCSKTSTARTMTYQIQTSNSTPIIIPINFRENVPANTNSTCTNTVVTTGQVCNSTLNVQPGIQSEFNDYLWAGCPGAAVIPPCGFTFSNQQWQWCQPSGAETSIGTIGPDNVQNDVIYVDNNALPWNYHTFLP